VSPEVIATVLTGAGVLFGVWRMVDSARRELGARIDAVNTRLSAEIAAVNTRLSAEIAAVNTRIDNILLADRKT